MAKVTNLNQFRKSKARTERKLRAQENAVKFGRNKAEKQQDTSEPKKLQKHLDDHKRDKT